jgi:hypothetical protein
LFAQSHSHDEVLKIQVSLSSSNIGIYYRM